MGVRQVCGGEKTKRKKKQEKKEEEEGNVWMQLSLEK